MEQRDLGRTGLRVSALGYGAGAVGGLMVLGDPAEQKRAVARALDAGITYFDTAPGYGNGRSEETLGRALRELDAWGRVVVGTKVRVGPEDLADPIPAIRRSCEASLRRLGRDSVDLIQLHNQIRRDTSGPTAASNGLPLDATLGAVAEGLQQLVRDGLAGHVGYTGLGDADATAAIARDGRFATVQTYYNAANPSAGTAGASGGGQDFAGLIGTAAANGLGVIVIRSMAAGALTGAPERHENASDPGSPLAGGPGYTHDIARARALAPLAQELGLESTLELTLRFAESTAGVSTVIVGYSDLAQLEDAIRWTARGPLPIEARERVVALARDGVAG
jgi:aryl-alcohol dehydrogenase-like predicted oxidoreductase